MKAVVIRPDGRYSKIEYETATEYETIKENVGGYIEAVGAVSPDGAEMTFWCHEEGKILGMDLNEGATGLWWFISPAMFKQDVLVGTIVITGGPGPDGETLGLSEAQEALLDDLFDES